jgi:tRNA dimethylallyltransferase
VHQLTGRPISAQQREWDQRGPRRSDWSWTLIGLRREREDASRRINARVKRMIAEGLVEEARRIWCDPRGVGAQASKAVGYAELFEHFQGRITLERAIEEIKISSRRLAKSQRTWLRAMRDVRWIDVGADDRVEDALPAVLAVLASRRPPVPGGGSMDAAR